MRKSRLWRPRSRRGGASDFGIRQLRGAFGAGGFLERRSGSQAETAECGGCREEAQVQGWLRAFSGEREGALLGLVSHFPPRGRTEGL